MILLSFDTEEFDLPRESGVDISIDESIRVSEIGTNIILDILNKESVKATFFCTTTFAQLAPSTMQRLLMRGMKLHHMVVIIGIRRQKMSFKVRKFFMNLLELK